MNYPVAICTDRNEIRLRINGLRFTKFRYWDHMVNMDKVFGVFTVEFPKVKTAGKTCGAMKCFRLLF